MKFNELVKRIILFFQSEKILNKIPEVVLYLDWEGYILSSNETAQNYYGILRNIHINDIISDGMKHIRHSIKYKKAIVVDTKIYGNDFLAELNASKTNKNYYVTLRNKTPYMENIELKNNTEKFTEEKNVMIAKIADEIKSPINSISGFTQGLLDGIAGELSEKQAKYLKIIKNNTEDLDALMTKFIDFSYCESSLFSLETKKIDVVNSIKDTVKELKKNNKYKNLEIDIDYTSISNRSIYFDEYTLKQTITNIIEASYITTKNNIISMHLSVPDAENSISFGLDESKKHLQIYIKDSGTGFSKDELMHICNPYAQLDKDKKNIVRSYCLGIASILIKRAHGFFNISSELKQGTIYNIIIPIEKAQDE